MGNLLSVYAGKITTDTSLGDVENVATWTTATANAFENYNEAVNYVKYPDDEILFISESSFSFLKPPFNLIF